MPHTPPGASEQAGCHDRRGGRARLFGGAGAAAPAGRLLSSPAATVISTQVTTRHPGVTRVGAGATYFLAGAAGFSAAGGSGATGGRSLLNITYSSSQCSP